MFLRTIRRTRWKSWRASVSRSGSPSRDRRKHRALRCSSDSRWDGESGGPRDSKDWRAFSLSRTGPGAYRGVKPDVVDYGGNWVVNDSGNLEYSNPGVATVSLGDGGGRLFGLAAGTSLLRLA